MSSKNIGGNVVLSISLVMGFIFIATLGALYAERNFIPSCTCIFPPWIIIIAFASLGVFIGTLTYYFLTKQYVSDNKTIKKGLKNMLNFLDNDDKKIIMTLVKNSGTLSQSKMSELTKLDKVKLSRRIDVLVSKNIISKEKNGMTNKIILDNNILEIFKENSFD